MLRSFPLLALSAIFSTTAFAQTGAADPLAWPPITKDNRPGTRWWWMGSAVNAEDLAREMKAMKEAGLGTVEITPIYGVKGGESLSIDYLSPKWMEMLKVVADEGRKLDINVDMVTGTGWCFGGPNVGDKDANAVAVYRNGTVTQKPSGVKVKRPAPGGAGWMLNLIYPDAMTRYLERFDKALSTYNGPLPNAQFHDSYEYQSDWSPDFFQQFLQRRGYKLEDRLPELFEGKGDPDEVARVKSDYRETVSDLVTESVSRWTEWSHQHKMRSRNQAHGSPGNWLDIYAASDIPETEIDFFRGGEVLISKFASSAAHVTGKNIVSSETATWAAEHFTESLSLLKGICDGFYLAGVNRIMWHGTTYSPADAAWPGWCFYASTEMNSRNAIWYDAPALHAYLSRVQSQLQSGRPGNDVLLYWPIHDLWHSASSPRKVLVEGMSVHGSGWFKDQPVGKMAGSLLSKGYAFDYISDKLLQNAKSGNGEIDLAGNKYRAIIVPNCKRMPLESMRKLQELSSMGATVLFAGDVPQDVPGLNDLEKRRASLRSLTGKLAATSEDKIDEVLGKVGVWREKSLSNQKDVHFVRRVVAGGTLYFIANRGKGSLDQAFRLADPSPHAALLDPMTGRSGIAQTEDGAVRLQLAPGQSMFVRTFGGTPPSYASQWSYIQSAGSPVALSGKWNVKFLQGGPTLPKPVEADRLASWTSFGGEEFLSFAGTALYTLKFDSPNANVSHWLLDLGQVIQSARVRLNGKDLGTFITAPFQIPLESLNARDNLLEVAVTGTSANRIRDLDVRGVEWKIFHDANVLNRKYKKFDASRWPIADQGLLGPVTLEPQRR
ncbi:MAG: glycosyl hydrolase [Luteolibacter sp.]